MKPIHFAPFIFTILSLIFCPIFTKANDGKPTNTTNINKIVLPVMVDTIPPKNKDAASSDNAGGDVIKVLPKARKQAIPIPVNLAVKPVIIIKPIVKPIIKILH